jgi:hypothetical protein
VNLGNKSGRSATKNRGGEFMNLYSVTGSYVAALSLMAVVLSSCGGGGGAGSSGVGDGGGIPSASTAKLAASQPGELVRYFQDRLAVRAANGIYSAATPGVVFSPGPSPSGSPVSFSSSTVQESGVDEDDLLKTDGSMLYSLVRDWATGSGANLVPPSKLQAHRREADGRLTALSALALAGDAYYNGLYLNTNAKRVVLLGQHAWVGLPITGGPNVAFSMIAPPRQSKTSLEIVDVSAPAAPSTTHTITIDGRLGGSRMIGNHLYLVSTWTPDLLADRLPAGSPDRSAATARLVSADILPTITINRERASALVLETDCYVQPANASTNLEITTITMIDVSSPTLERSSKCFVGGSETVYVSPTNAYVASTRYSYGPDAGRGIVFSANASTDIHKFSLTGIGVDYRGSGSVVGHLGWDTEKKPYRMSEHEGDLRVLTFTGETGWTLPAATPGVTTPTPNFSNPPSPATLSVLRENLVKRNLEVLASLPNNQRPAALGKPGEQVYAVRFAGPRAYLVTFRRIDPLYVLDLSTPGDPKAVGELTAAGYSDYLFPLDGGLMLGVGKDADASGMVGGVKVALLDVANPASPKELATRIYGKAGSASALDTSRHGINLFQQGDTTRVALPVRINDAQTAGGGWFAPSAQGLVRLEIDRTARTLTEKPMLSSIFFTTEASRQQAYGAYDVGQERSVQIGGHVYYLSGGSLRGEAW